MRCYTGTTSDRFSGWYEFEVSTYNRIVMETVCFERKAFEEFAMKIERFIHRVEGIPIWI